jgi:hypothetical protein
MHFIRDLPRQQLHASRNEVLRALARRVRLRDTCRVRNRQASCVFDIFLLLISISFSFHISVSLLCRAERTPLRVRRLLDVEHGHFEAERGVRRYLGTHAFRTVADAWPCSHHALATNFGAAQRQLPRLDHFASTHRKAKRGCSLCGKERKRSGVEWSKLS